MEQSASWENYSRLVGHEIHETRKLISCVHKNTLLDPILSQINAIRKLIGHAI
jgi:hypothetical protein